jgi:hypothetical protein
MLKQLGMPSALLLAALLASAACSDKKRPGSAPLSDGGSSVAGKASLVSGGADSGGNADSGGADSSPAGQGGSGAGDGSLPNAGQAGDGSVNPSGGAGPDPIPPVGDPPICPHALKLTQGTLVALSGGGDDLLEAITPDELTIAWKNGSHRYIADRNDIGFPFGAPLEIVNAAQYRSVSLSSDGLTLVAVTNDLAVVQQTRAAGEAFDDASPAAGDFQAFNTTVATIPLANQVLADAVISANDASFFFSHFVSTDAGSYESVHESHRSGGVWDFSSPNLGKLLYASDQQRRIPTGVSSDTLTLFYLDEVQGDFRAAWRVNPQVQFNYSEALDLGVGTTSAVPNEPCTRIYYSAQGASDLDLFVSSVAP